MKKLLVAATALFTVAMIGPSGAADLPMKAPPPAAPVFTWTGFYIGVNAGGTWGNFGTGTSVPFSPTGYFDPRSNVAIGAAGQQNIGRIDGFIGGFQAGYNWQTGPFVVGIEGDINSFRLSGNAVTGPVPYPCCPTTNFTIASSASTDWLATIRGRIGIATSNWLFANNWLFYLTGGAAFTDLKANFAFTDTFAAATESASISNTRTGGVAGVGVEAGLWQNWTVKVEWLHVAFDRAAVTSTNLTSLAGPFPTSVFTHTVDLRADIVRFGVNYRFGAL